MALKDQLVRIQQTALDERERLRSDEDSGSLVYLPSAMYLVADAIATGAAAIVDRMDRLEMTVRGGFNLR